MFRNVNTKDIRIAEDKLNEVFNALHKGKPLTKLESSRLELEEKELVRLLENLYQDKYPETLVPFQSRLLFNPHSLVDPSIMVKDDWPTFLVDRREKLRQMVVKACGGNVQPFTDELEEFESEQDDEL